MRRSPWRWITGSATPSSLTRLRSVVTFCWRANSRVAWAASSSSARRSRKSSPRSSSVTTRSGNSRPMRRAASSLASAVRSRTRTAPSGPRATERYRTRASRRSVRTSPAYRSSAWATAAGMSTSMRKWTPPRRSRPRYIGRRPVAASHRGMAGARLRATIWPGPRSARRRSCALSWASVSPKRARIRPSSRVTRWAGTPPDSRTPDTRAARPGSTATPRSPEICTAGSSPNTFGSAKRNPAARTATMRRCFQSG